MGYLEMLNSGLVSLLCKLFTYILNMVGYLNLTSGYFQGKFLFKHPNAKAKVQWLSFVSSLTLDKQINLVCGI